MSDASPPDPAPSGDAPSPAAGVRVYQGLVGLLLAALLGAWALFDRVYERQARLVTALEGQVATATSAAAAASASAAAAAARLTPEVLLEKPIDITDVGARFAEVSRQFHDKTDYSESYYGSASASVHLHLMAEEQTCPLHLHRRSTEATVIVSGLAEVTQTFGPDLTTRTGTFAPGALIASPPRCGHRWVNRSASEKLGNLVFSLPRFEGNLYVRGDDDKLRQGAAPTLYDPAEDLAALAAGAEPSRRRALPLMDGRLGVLLVKDTARLETRRGSPIILYVTRGAGALDNGRVHPLRERFLAVIDGGPTVTVRAEGGPLAAVRFDPEEPAGTPPR